MSGPITSNKNLTRRQFVLGTSAAGLGVWSLYHSNSIYDFIQKQKLSSLPIKSYNQDHIGHKMREVFDPSTYELAAETNVAILGAGISGLTCGYYLKKNSSEDFKIFDLGETVGGNSSYFESGTKKGSWGAHYLPLPSTENKQLIQFLEEQKIILGYEGSKPIYEEEFLCHDPHERLSIRGGWQNSLLPDHGISPSEKAELARFKKLTSDLKFAKGQDGKWAFDIPVDHSSKDPKYLSLDKISFHDYLQQNGFQTEAVQWLCNYACLDDFGTHKKLTSAWAGLHYFCSRRSESANADSDAVLVWPEGNGYLKDRLSDPIQKHLKTQHLIRFVEKTENGFQIYINDLALNKNIIVPAKKVVYALPRYTAKSILKSEEDYSNLHYNPWVVAHILVNKKALTEHHPLAWDTVQYQAAGLGYINNDHQLTNPLDEKTLITYYHAFSSEKGTQEDRQALRQYDDQKMRALIVQELTKMHPYIQSSIERIDYKILGHAMISPQVDFIWNTRLKKLPQIKNSIIFAHSDMSGMSIFEEAFYQGHQAFLKIQKGKNGLA